MRTWRFAVVGLTLIVSVGVRAGQDDGGGPTPAPAGGRGGARGAPAGPPAEIRWRTGGGAFDMQQVERGRASFAACGVCHGPDARGGQGLTSVSLLGSEIIDRDDRKGTNMTAYLKSGHPQPDKMGPIMAGLDAAKLADLAEWIHYQIAVASERQNYRPLNVLTGDPKAGETYFNASCQSCHSVTGAFKGIGSRYEPMQLQNAILSGAGGGRGRGGASATAKTATVTTTSGQKVSGTLVRLSDFLVTIRDAGGTTRSFIRTDGVPAVSVTDPMQPHIDLAGKYTDRDLHNLTAYLATLKYP